MGHQLVVVILTYNEEVHIARAINNVHHWADKIIVLDSHSTDKTVQIAESFGVEVIFRKFDSYKNQRQHAIEYCKNITEWMFFLDADEYLLEETKDEIKQAINKKNGMVGYYLSFRFIFMDKWIKHGGYYPCYLMRLFRPQTAILHDEFNEHVSVTGPSAKLKGDFVDHRLKDIASWIDKHNTYAMIEALSLWKAKHNRERTKNLNLFIQTERKKWFRENIWNHLPLLLKSIAYFFYRYFVRFGFLDGREGFIYHALQAGWYHFLVDVKYIELKKKKKTSALDFE